MSRNSYNFKCSDDVLSEYERKYSKFTMPEFLRRCLKKAVADRAFFEQVYFLSSDSALSQEKI